jgi:hypothetical protein
MANLRANTYCGSYMDDDSGIGVDYDYSSSSDRNSSRMTSIEPSPIIQSKTIPSPIPGLIGRKRIDIKPLIKFASDGIVERIRPATMKNSENGDFIICQTNRGAYIAYRTPIVPAWVTKLVHDIELRQK